MSDQGQLSPAQIARHEAHKHFDRLWLDVLKLADSCHTKNRRSKNRKHHRRMTRGLRRNAYAWLAFQLGIEFDACHFSMFDEHMCRKAIQVVQGAKPSDVINWKRGFRKAA